MVLAGPKSVTIHDTKIVTAPDLGNNFYAREEDVGKTTRAAASIGQLKELNPYVEVKNYEGELTTEFISGFDIVVFSDSIDREFLVKINEFCRT